MAFCSIKSQIATEFAQTAYFEWLAGCATCQNGVEKMENWVRHKEKRK
jgi:hypothetical protein